MFKFETIGADPEFFDIKPCPVGFRETIGDIKIKQDGVCYEAEIPPCKDVVEFVGEVSKLSYFIKHEKFFTSPAYFFTDEELYHKSYWEVGCSPFFVVGKGKVKPVPYSDHNRFAGGHIHLGYDRSLVDDQVVVMILDKILYDLDPGRNPLRDRFYGQRMAFRPKPYGIEYRSLSSMWINDPEWIIDGLMKAEKAINKFIEKTSK